LEKPFGKNFCNLSKDHFGMTVVYFTHDQGDELRDWINWQNQSTGGQVGVVGHSWGGDTAARVVADGAKVAVLVTIDPVGHSIPEATAAPALRSKPEFPQLALPPQGHSLQDIHNNSGTWLNVHLSGNPSRSSWFPNSVAWLGAQWKDSPNGHATRHYVAQGDHDEFGRVVNPPRP
jgi:pimeloyl-ACP methyl ester carboxylesterase